MDSITKNKFDFFFVYIVFLIFFSLPILTYIPLYDLFASDEH